MHNAEAGEPSGTTIPGPLAQRAKADDTMTTQAPVIKTAALEQASPVPNTDSARPAVKGWRRENAAQTQASSKAYEIGPLDVLEIEVFKVPELSKTVQVAGNGTVNLPLVGEIPAAGRTRREFEQKLTAMLGEKYLQNPQITVTVKEHNSQRVTVEGAVRKPGLYNLKGRMSLLQVIAMAEGLDKNSDDTVVVLRPSEGKRNAEKFDIDAIRGGQEQDPIIQSGDMILAGTSAIKEAVETFKGLPVGVLLSALLL